MQEEYTFRCFKQLQACRPRKIVCGQTSKCQQKCAKLHISIEGIDYSGTAVFYKKNDGFCIDIDYFEPPLQSWKRQEVVTFPDEYMDDYLLFLAEIIVEIAFLDVKPNEFEHKSINIL